MSSRVSFRSHGTSAVLELSGESDGIVLTIENVRELSTAIERLADDDEARVGIVRSTSGSFCVGVDLGAPARGPDGHPDLWGERDRYREVVAVLGQLWECPKPLIAEVQGSCAGFGVALATACDLTYVATTARVSSSALPLDAGLTEAFFGWYTGPKRAKEFSFCGGLELDGDRAVAWGLANRAFPADELRDAVEDVADRIARLSSSLLHLKKSAVNRVFDSLGYAESLRSGAEWAVLARQDPSVEEIASAVARDGLKEVERRWQDH